MRRFDINYFYKADFMPIIETFMPNENCMIGIWLITENKEQLGSLCGDDLKLMNESELISSEQKKKEFIASRILLNALSLSFIGESKALIKDKNNKPFLSGYEGNISISHSGTYCAVIIHRCNYVGIDIEQTRTKLDHVKTKFLSTRELKLFNTLERLCIAWCAKETIYKKMNKKELNFIKDISLNEVDGDIIMAECEKRLHKIYIKRYGDYIMTYSY